MSQSLQAYVTDPTSCAIDRATNIVAPVPPPRAQKHHEKAVARCAKSTVEFTRLAWSIAAPRGYSLLDAWAIFADAFGRESLGYDGYHYTYSLKNFREKGGGGKLSSRERDGAPPRCTVVGVLDFIRASRLLDEHVCPAACAPQ